MPRSILHARHLRTAPDPTGPTPTGGGGGTAAPVVPPGAKIATPAVDTFTDPDSGETYKFPADKRIADMTSDQQAEYWRHKARKHEARANAAPKDYDDVVRERDELKAKHQTAEEKALEQAREEARREGENIGADRYLASAVRGEIRGSNPNLTAEQVDALMQVIDPRKLLNDKGDIDTSKIAGAVAGLAPQGATPPLQLHQGGRRASSGATGRDRGLAEAERRGFIQKQA